MRIKVPSEISNYEPSYLSSDCFLDTSKNVCSYKVKCRNDECNSKSYKTRYKNGIDFVERELCIDCGYSTSTGNLNFGQIEFARHGERCFWRSERILNLSEINYLREYNNLKTIKSVPLFAVAQYMRFQDVIEYDDGDTLWKRENDGYIYGYEYVDEVA